MHNPLIPFNKPYSTGHELEYLAQVLSSNHLSGDGQFTQKCHSWLENHTNSRKALLTHSCTAALEMAAMLIGISAGDEIIMPSYTFVSTANAFVLRGGIPVFVDIRPDTQNINEALIEVAITSKTKAIVPVHYAGVACDMDTIMDIANRYDLFVIEDAAQAIGGQYKGRALGSIGHLGCYSFHQTKNIQCGEGGALLINDDLFLVRAEILREKGTNRRQFVAGQVDKYTWVDIGSSYLMADILAACLYGQFSKSKEIQGKRKIIWDTYFDGLKEWAVTNRVQLPYIPDVCEQAFHMFYLILPSTKARSNFIEHMNSEGITTVFHYLPLHESPMGKQFNTSNNKCPVTCGTSDRLVRLPFFNDLTHEELTSVISVVKQYVSGALSS